jgi:hypothetical protein
MGSANAALEGAVVMGNVDEIAREAQAYADEGCEHAMLINHAALELVAPAK